MTNVFIADDHSIVRKGFRQIIEETPNMSVIGEAGSGDEVLTKARTENWDILVLDLSMPGRGGLDVLQELHAMKPRMPILVLSMHPEDQYAVRTLKAGASGYVNKESAVEELVTAIQKVVDGGRYVSPEFAEKLAFDLTRNSTKALHEALSDREYRVLCMLGAGKRVSEIATDLIISVKTVSTYRARILEKMNLTSNAEIIRYTIENNLA